MTFEDAIREMLAHCAETLTSKRKEYAIGSDFHNFEIAAELQGCTREQALGGMKVKHTVSVFDMIGTGEKYPAEKWLEKLGDDMCYDLLLWAMVRMEQAEPVADPEEEEPKPEPKPTKKPAKEPAKKKVDHGRIVALYKGNRSVAWIADDMKISEQTVRNHLRKEGLVK